jgi:hypothetical protein
MDWIDLAQDKGQLMNIPSIKTHRLLHTREAMNALTSELEIILNPSYLQYEVMIRTDRK